MIRCFSFKVKEWDEKGLGRWKTYRRQKREWIKFAAACREGEDNSKRNPIARIRSDCEETQPIIYKISGVGIDQHPIGVFVINQKTGEINITKIVDREENPVFIIKCHAINVLTGKSVETPLDLRVRVLDINDNAPVFTQTTFSGSIIESSMENTLVMKITAIDADEPNNLNSKIAYKIVSQTPGGQPRFILNTETGELHIANALDREEHSRYTLVVKATDRDGAPDGISSECLCHVAVEDVNDNFPTFSQSSYSVSISENSLSQDLLRIQILDEDEEFSDNWVAQFEFLSGNEQGNFEITVDPRTNEGILRVVKGIDYEQFSSMPLRIGVRNPNPFHYSVVSQSQSQFATISVQVLNVPEGPSFSPSVIAVTASESLTSKDILTYEVAKFQAIDQDTGRVATNVRYMMGRDPAAWFQVNPTTGQITFKQVIDRESIYVVDGVYSAELLAITRDSPFMTATGTIVVTVQDVNDNCPIVTEEIRQVCVKNPSVIITAKDPDAHPYGPPFKFTIVAHSPENSWDIRIVNETSAALYSTNIKFVIHQVQVRVFDNSGRSCEKPLVVPLQACHCDQHGRCVEYATQRTTITIIVQLTVENWHFLFVLSVVPILMSQSGCCGYLGSGPVGGVGAGFEPVPECTEGAIHSWGIEGAQPEDRVPLKATCNNIDAGVFTEIYTTKYADGGMVSTGVEETTGLGTAKGYGTTAGYGTTTGYGTTGRKETFGGTIKEYRESGVNMAFLDSYFSEKAFAYADEDEGRPANDCLLIYDHEGIGTPVGSIGCCSFIGDDLDDTYLDTLGPKFKTLAEICLGVEIEPFPDVNAPRPSLPNPDIDLNLPPPGSTIVINTSSPLLPPTAVVRPIPDPVLPGNVVVTETYTSGPTLKPPTISVDPLSGSNVVVTERVLAPAAVTDLHGMIDIPDLPDGSNVVVTERVIAPNSRIPASMSIPDLTDGSRGMNAGVGGMSGVGGVGSITGHMLGTDNLLNQTIGSVSPGTSRRRVMKYSTIQYSNQ
uniref:Desmoglein 1 n=1 Tax=Varanus komodoensis TaxID=61221 RepID=A0A8D2JI29_VARKO